jgi:G6PDH family F420-dependent oxidoreductase
VTVDARIGFSLSSEEHPPADLVRYGATAVAHGFRDVIVSDHYHPWNEAQGESPFVWSVLGGLAAACPEARVGTGVTCPTMRIHPAIIAQAAATTSRMAGGGFFLGVGSGENLNEHVLGDRWVPADERLEMLEEAVEVMRALWTGDEVTHRGAHYRVENARLYTAPSGPVPVYVSAFGPKACDLAARIGDGLVTTGADGEMVERYRAAGGTGPLVGIPKTCWAQDEDTARQTVFRLWPNTGLPGELAQELRTPAHFEQACSVLDVDDVVGSMAVGPDPEPYVDTLREYLDLGYDEIYLQQIGGQQEEAIGFFRDEVLARL